MNKELTLRALIIGGLGSLVITASSVYVALRLGALPWPTIFVAILSLSVLKCLGKTNLREINIAHTAMSAGAMVAGGLAFTAPAIWILDRNAEFDILKILILTVSGTLLGLAATAISRRYFIETEKENYPFPIGVAAFETVSAGDQGGRHAAWLFSSLALSAAFTVVRDWFGKIPALINAEKLATRNIFAGIWLSPMAVGIGYIVGPVFSGVWALGAVIGFALIIPLGIRLDLFTDVEAAHAFRRSLGIGLMLGTGIGVLLKGIFPRLKSLLGSAFARSGTAIFSRWFPLAVFVIILVLLPSATEFRQLDLLSVPAVLITLAGAVMAAIMAAVLTGQTGINPMELLGILVLLVVKFIAADSTGVLVSAAVVTAVAAGLAGDMMNDYRAGYLFGTNPRNQRIAEAIGALIASLLSVGVLYLLITAYGTESLGSPDGFPAPQAHAVATMATGIPHLISFWAGVLLGTLFFVIKLPSMTLGLGIYLPVFITAPIFLGGLISWLTKKPRQQSSAKHGTIIASGLLGGEAVTGVVIAAVKAFQALTAL